MPSSRSCYHYLLLHRKSLHIRQFSSPYASPRWPSPRTIPRTTRATRRTRTVRGVHHDGSRCSLALHCTALHAFSCTPGVCGCTAVYSIQTRPRASSALRFGAALTCSSHSPSPHQYTRSRTPPQASRRRRSSATAAPRGCVASSRQSPSEPEGPFRSFAWRH